MFDILKTLCCPEQTIIEWLTGCENEKSEIVNTVYEPIVQKNASPNFASSYDYVKRVFEYAINNSSEKSIFGDLPSTDEFIILFEHTSNNALFGLSKDFKMLPVKKAHFYIVKLNKSQMIDVIMLMYLQKENLVKCFQKMHIASINNPSFNIELTV